MSLLSGAISQVLLAWHVETGISLALKAFGMGHTLVDAIAFLAVIQLCRC